MSKIKYPLQPTAGNTIEEINLNSISADCNVTWQYQAFVCNLFIRQLVTVKRLGLIYLMFLLNKQTNKHKRAFPLSQAWGKKGYQIPLEKQNPVRRECQADLCFLFPVSLPLLNFLIPLFFSPHLLTTFSNPLFLVFPISLLPSLQTYMPLIDIPHHCLFCTKIVI